MRKLNFAILLISMGMWLGCGGDDDPVGPDEPTIITVTAVAGSTAPARMSVDDAVWTAITPKTIPITASQFSVAKSRPVSALAVAPNVKIQATVVDDTLYLRLAWSDDSWDRWPGRFSVTGFQYPGNDTLPIFTHDNMSAREDQALVLFKGPGEINWDAWQWRMTTTGAAYLAQGYMLIENVLVRDFGNESVVTSNVDTISGNPIYMHTNGQASDSYRLIPDSIVAIDYYLPWDSGQFLPGWIINDTLYQASEAARGSKFDINSFSRYASNEYVVVLSRSLAGSTNDLDMTGPITLDCKIGITNNADFIMTQGYSEQGFSSTFKLVIP